LTAASAAQCLPLSIGANPVTAHFGVVVVECRFRLDIEGPTANLDAVGMMANRARRLCRAALLSFGAMTMAAACGGDGNGNSDDDGGSSTPAVCGDGVVADAEQCDGADFGAGSCATLGFEEGGLACNADCTVDLQGCYLLDEDGDGLNIHDEFALGTDATNPDSDGDGVLDGVEVQNGSNPLDAYSWPQGIGSWPNRLAAAQAAGVAGEGTNEGQVMSNFTWTDQFGQPVDLHQFYGYVVVFSAGARWCPPCNEAASTSQGAWDAKRDLGVIYVELLLDGTQPGVIATLDDATIWADQYDLHYPVLWGPQQPPTQAVPTYWILDRSMRVVTKIEGFPGDLGINAQVDKAIAQSNQN
jgi:AhpC/TSA family/Bacterial TSP3 repeat